MAQTKLVDLVEHHLELPGEEFVSVFLRHGYWTLPLMLLVVLYNMVLYKMCAKANNLAGLVK